MPEGGFDWRVDAICGCFSSRAQHEYEALGARVPHQSALSIGVELLNYYAMPRKRRLPSEVLRYFQSAGFIQIMNTPGKHRATAFISDDGPLHKQRSHAIARMPHGQFSRQVGLKLSCFGQVMTKKIILGK